MATETDVFGVDSGVQSEGSWKEGLNQLEGSSLERAAKEWLQYLKNFDEISVVFDKHQNAEGFLEKSELRKVGSLFWQQPACKQLSSAKRWLCDKVVANNLPVAAASQLQRRASSRL